MLETKETATEISYNEHAILKMDAAFRARMHAAIAVGREYAPIGIGTEPGLGVANALRLPDLQNGKNFSHWYLIKS
jgi:hypothetical protein